MPAYSDMAERQQSGDGSGDGFDRRTYLKLASSAAAVAATGFAGSAVALPSEYDPDTVVDLGEEGLTNGDVIDPYLEEFFENNVEVRIPEGEYDWEGDGFHRNAEYNAGVIGEGEVILNATAGEFNNNILASGGTVVVKNLTVRGKVTESRIRLECESDGHIVVDNWNFPDGSETDDRSRAFYSPREHAGVVEIHNCYISEFSDNGIYASSPGYEEGGEDGQIIIDGCVTHNVNIAGIRVGSTNSIVRDCVVINDAKSPDTGFAHNQRGIWVRGSGDDIVIENCDVVHSWDGATAPINFAMEGTESSGHIENVRVYNNASHDAIRNVPDSWSGNNIDVTGDGNLTVPGWFTDVCQGSDCVSASSDTSTDTSDTTTETTDTTDTTEDTNTETGTEISLRTTNSGGIEYEFTTTGEVTPLYNRDSFPANSDTDGAEQNDDGTWTGFGATSGGISESGDSFRFEGDLLDYSVSGDVDSLTLYADGEAVDFESLVVEEDSSTDESTAGSTDGSTDTTDSTDDTTEDSSTTETLPNRVIVDGTNTDTVASYELSVSGDIEADASLSSTLDGGTKWDDLEDEVGDGTVTGVVGKGMDGFRYSGELTSVTIEGAVAITVESSDL